MCNFGSREEWRKGRRVVSSYLDVETTKYQFYVLNPTPLYCISRYIIHYAVGERALKRLTQIRLNFIDGSISSYCSILNSPERIEQISQAKKLVSVLCDLDSDRTRKRSGRRRE